MTSRASRRLAGSLDHYTHVDGKPIADTDGDVTSSSLDLASGACPTVRARSQRRLGLRWTTPSSARLASDITEGIADRFSRDAFIVQIADGGAWFKAVVGVDRTHAHYSVYVANALGDAVTTATVAAERVEPGPS
jgi:hypothetical protein